MWPSMIATLITFLLSGVMQLDITMKPHVKSWTSGFISGLPFGVWLKKLIGNAHYKSHKFWRFLCQP